jgi:hypothetical protein
MVLEYLPTFILMMAQKSWRGPPSCDVGPNPCCKGCIHVSNGHRIYLLSCCGFARMVNEHVYYISQYLVGGLSPSEKYESQLG